MRLSGDDPPHRDLVVSGELSGHFALRIIEHELDRGLTDWLPAGRAVKNDLKKVINFPEEAPLFEMKDGGDDGMGFNFNCNPFNMY